MERVIVGESKNSFRPKVVDGFSEVIIKTDFIDDNKKKSSGYRKSLVHNDRVREYSAYCRVLTEKEAQLWRDGFFDPENIIIEAKRRLMTLPDGTFSQKSLTWKTIINKCADIKAERFQVALEKEAMAKANEKIKKKN